MAPFTCKAYPIATLMHGHCAIYAPPPTHPVYAIHHTILAMAISCKGQAWRTALGERRILWDGGGWIRGEATRALEHFAVCVAKLRPEGGRAGVLH